MSWQTGLFIGLMAALVAFTMFLSYSGAALPRPDEAEAMSLREVGARRTHFFTHYALGK